MGFKYILFDLDGTLTNPEEGIHKSINYALRQMGEAEVPKEEINKFIGPPLKDGYMQNLGFTEEKSVEAVALYRKRYKNIGLYENELIEGAEQLLKNLRQKDKVIGMATSKPEDLAIKLMKHFKLYEYFDFIGGAEWNTNGRNEKADIIRYTLDNLGVKPDEYKNCVIIGDRHHDITGARIAGISVIAVQTGFGEIDELKNADFIAENLLEAEKFV